MTGQHRPRRTDSNGIPKPVVKGHKAVGPVLLKCGQCLYAVRDADYALARIHVKTYPDHIVTLSKTTVVNVQAFTTDGVDWVDAVNGL